MPFYFSLQFKRFYRLLQSIGIHPIIGGIGLLVFFIGLSYLLFQRVSYAPYVYIVLGWSVANLLGERNRNEFLKTIYPLAAYQKMRILENLIIVTPFVLFLCFQQAWMEALALYFIGGMSAFLNKVNRFNWVIPTPFYRFPFEFTRGFRKTFWILVFLYALMVISVIYENYYMGIFSLVSTIFTCCGYYTKPEAEFYIWVHAETPAIFLWKKMGIALVYCFLLSLPLLITLWILYPERMHITLVLAIFAWALLAGIILGKYAYYPAELNLITNILLTVCLVFPPLLLFVMPFFYIKAKRNLSTYL